MWDNPLAYECQSKYIQEPRRQEWKAKHGHGHTHTPQARVEAVLLLEVSLQPDRLSWGTVRSRNFSDMWNYIQCSCSEKTVSMPHGRNKRGNSCLMG